MNRRDEIRDTVIQLLLGGDFTAGEAVEQAVEIQNEMDTWDFDDDCVDEAEPTIVGLHIVGVNVESGQMVALNEKGEVVPAFKSPVDDMAKKLERAIRDWQDEITSKAVDHSIARRCQDIASKACGYVGVCNGVSPEQSVQDLADRLKTAKEELTALEAQIRSLQQCNSDCREMAAKALGVDPTYFCTTRDAVNFLINRYTRGN